MSDIRDRVLVTS